MFPSLGSGVALYWILEVPGGSYENPVEPGRRTEGSYVSQPGQQVALYWILEVPGRPYENV